MSSSTSTILIWGDTQVGKSTLLTTALMADDSGLTGIDRAQSARAIATTVVPQYQRLSACHWVSPTVRQPIDIDLVTTAGTPIRLRDVPGSLTRDIHLPDVQQRLMESSAVLYLVEWNAQDLNRQMAAIRSTWRLLDGKPQALAITKCERGLTMEDEAWQCAPGWWRRGRWLNHGDLLEQFGSAVFPTTAYGYHFDTGLPALIIGEYGQLLPFGFRPRGVGEPLQNLLVRMGAT